MRLTTYITLFGLILFISCSAGNQNDDIDIFSETHNNSEDQDNRENSCGLDDDTYSATVDYYNPETGYSQTYTLDVEVSDCQVIQINFPKEGWLDEDHIKAVDIDEDGNATVDGEDGKTYEINIDN